MKRSFKDAAHLLRLAGLFLGALLVFLVVRSLVVPADFGIYGHFRAGAMDDNRLHEPKYAGRAACEGCHTAVVEARHGSKHAIIGCEACHGALAAHAQDPGSVKPELPRVVDTCLVCHRQNIGKPKGFPVIDPVEHAGAEPCTTCHKVHHPDAEV